ncbi:MAG: hypothetical protein GY717_11735 [Rhodobacteraceae bacterium]|nr:hypothetical protein [Paracoccaceae bacterium]
MTMIHHIQHIKDAQHRAFVAERLRALKDRLRTDIGACSSSRAMRLATWNLKHFGKGSCGSTQYRGIEPMLYIA